MISKKIKLICKVSPITGLNQYKRIDTYLLFGILPIMRLVVHYPDSNRPMPFY